MDVRVYACWCAHSIQVIFISVRSSGYPQNRRRYLFFPEIVMVSEAEKNLCPVLLAVLGRQMHRGSPDCEKHVHSALKALCDFYTCMDLRDQEGRRPLFWSSAHIADFRGVIDRFLLHNNWLCHFFRDKGMKLYHRVSKHHTLWHLGHEAQHRSPWLATSYMQEGLQGKLAVLVNASRHGQSPALRSKAPTT